MLLLGNVIIFSIKSEVSICTKQGNLHIPMLMLMLIQTSKNKHQEIHD